MGHTWVDVKISDAEKKKSARVKALVDTGASLTVLPSKLAKELHIKPLSEEKVSTEAGEVNIKRGRAWITLEGKEDIFSVWISDIIDKVLIGVVTLETLGLEVDPVSEKLKQRRLLLYFFDKS